jgi:transcriptional regulator with XRE-family HTH domain
MALMSISKILGENLRKLRRDRGFTQSELAEKAGVSATMITFYENGHKWPYPDTIKSLAKALKVPESDLFQDQKVSAANDSFKKVLSELETLKQNWNGEPHAVLKAFLSADERLRLSVEYLLGLKDPTRPSKKK